MDLLFEIGTEEIPPSYIRPALETLKSGVGASLAELGIEVARIRTFGTPRRMVLIVDGVDERARDRTETVFGPPADRAFDQSGKPTPAAAGFAKKQGVDVADLKTGTKGKGEYVCEGTIANLLTDRDGLEDQNWPQKSPRCSRHPAVLRG